ncbi:tRNA (guanosine(37)-N1)-methyltransferase TrmD [Alkalibaculum bacchi]|uniref:tRNA (guanosine(37)-N1)-methyltransferase TrmD n=1 Tax=Alkalibaculum bacchi TaxID=645887 RepID=UPI0026F25893|nr:tRNA (guanosine(37)-N1)-methyltransferase TrmD [Alkalibaculum bacchi]
MKFFVLTLFPEMFDSFLNTSILKKSIDKGLIEVELINIRDFTEDKHNKTDDYPFGGGPGMVMTPQPLASSIEYAKERSNNGKVIYFSPHGAVLRQSMVSNLAKEQDIILLCGHYEGIDYRIVEKYIDLQISIGDYIVTGGELPAMVFIDSVSRYVEGVLGNEESAVEESFTKPLLEHPQYTRPRVFEDLEVPEVLLSGNHEKIKQWRLSKSEEITQNNRPDLYELFKKDQ